LLAVNPDALAKRDGGTVVFVVKNDVATAVAVTPGIKIGDVVSIQGDVKSGDKVVVKPPESLVSGARVRLEGK